MENKANINAKLMLSVLVLELELETMHIFVEDLPRKNVGCM